MNLTMFSPPHSVVSVPAIPAALHVTEEVFFAVALLPNAGHGLLILEVF
jgi:hypothetical protein